MRRIPKFFHFPRSERDHPVRATFELCLIGFGLQFLLLRTPLMARVARSFAGQRGTWSYSPDQIGWAVSVAGRHVPGGGTCLPQALATHVLLEREGYAARLHIGVAKDEDGRLQAHAWVESLGRVVIGRSNAGRYTPVLAVDGEPR